MTTESLPATNPLLAPRIEGDFPYLPIAPRHSHIISVLKRECMQFAPDSQTFTTFIEEHFRSLAHYYFKAFIPALQQTGDSRPQSKPILLPGVNPDDDDDDDEHENDDDDDDDPLSYYKSKSPVFHRDLWLRERTTDMNLLDYLYFAALAQNKKIRLFPADCAYIKQEYDAQRARDTADAFTSETATLSSPSPNESVVETFDPQAPPPLSATPPPPSGPTQSQSVSEPAQHNKPERKNKQSKV